MLPGNWDPQNTPYGQAKPNDVGELPADLAHSMTASLAKLLLQDIFIAWESG